MDQSFESSPFRQALLFRCKRVWCSPLAALKRVIPPPFVTVVQNFGSVTQRATAIAAGRRLRVRDVTHSQQDDFERGKSLMEYRWMFLCYRRRRDREWRRGAPAPFSPRAHSLSPLQSTLAQPRSLSPCHTLTSRATASLAARPSAAPFLFFIRDLAWLPPSLGETMPPLRLLCATTAASTARPHLSRPLAPPRRLSAPLSAPLSTLQHLTHTIEPSPRAQERARAGPTTSGAARRAHVGDAAAALRRRRKRRRQRAAHLPRPAILRRVQGRGQRGQAPRAAGAGEAAAPPPALTHTLQGSVCLSLTHALLAASRARQPRRARSSSHRTRGGTRYARRQLPTFLSQVRNRATCHLGSPPTLPRACPDPIPCSSCLPFVLFSPPRWSLATWHTRNDARTVST